MGSRFGELAENYAGIRNYQDFVQMDTAPEQEKEIEKPDRIDARHMSFAYPDGNVALKDINLSLKEGEKVAIVGENGSEGFLFFLSFFFYVLNFIEISIDVGLYFRNKKLDEAADRAVSSDRRRGLPQ